MIKKRSSIPNGLYAPLVLFAYKRPNHLRKCWESLAKNKEAQNTDLIVFSDGWKKKEDQASVLAVRKEMKKIRGFRSVKQVIRSKNLGLAISIISGVTEACEQYGQCIVVEDDLEVSPFFLEFMNQGLSLYKKNTKVASIHGYLYPTKAQLPETFFLRGADCWGWATWKRAWKLFEVDAAKLLYQIRKNKLAHKFEMNGAYPYLRLLEDAARKGNAGSWAVRWHAACFVRNKLTLYPGRSLVINQGLDSSGTHCSSSIGLQAIMTPKSVIVKKIPCRESRAGKLAFEMHFRGIEKKAFLKTLWRKVLNWIHR